MQFNGAFGFDFSTIPEDMVTYHKGVQKTQSAPRTEQASRLTYLRYQVRSRKSTTKPSLISAPPASQRNSTLDGSESLGAHCEGPFISPTKNGIHSPEVLQDAPNGFSDFEACYGSENLPYLGSGMRSPISMITAAPEVPGVSAAIPQISTDEASNSASGTRKQRSRRLRTRFRQARQ